MAQTGFFPSPLLFIPNWDTMIRRRNIVEYNIHQDTLWFETGEIIGEYLNILDRVETNPRSYLIIPTRIPFSSQKAGYRQKLTQGITKGVDGESSYSNYQISNWFPFSWRYKVNVSTGAGRERLCFLYGDNIRRRLLFGDVPRESLTMIEEVLMNEVFNIPMDGLDKTDYADRIGGVLMEPLAAKTITIDHLHRYNDNRIRFDLVFDDMRYRLVCSVRELKKILMPELTLFLED